MQRLIFKSKTYSYIQRFAIEKLYELCHNRSLDSYRARTLNPKSSLEELYKVLFDWKKSRIKDFSTVHACIEETKSHVLMDESISYGLTSKESFIKLIESIKNSDNREEINQAEHSLYYLLNENSQYLLVLIQVINDLLNSTPKEHADKIKLLIKLDQYLGYFVTELINIGYSKSFLVKLISAIFVYGDEEEFSNAWSNFLQIFSSGEKTVYTVVFTIMGSKNQLQSLPIEQLKSTVDSEILGSSPSRKVSKYVEEMHSRKFAIFEVKAFDYYQTLKFAKNNMSIILDKIHLGYSNLKLKVKETALVISKDEPEKGDIQPIYYQIDGYYKSNLALYTSFLGKLDNIQSKNFISKEVTDRIESALRYLRLGNESIELEKKFVNYWIGLEFVFSSYNIKQSTFQRLKEYLVTSHLLHYVKRNLVQFRQDIKSYNLGDQMEGLDDDISSILNVSYLDRVISDFQSAPLLSYRASRIKSHLLNNSEKRKNFLKQHKNHLEWHLIRIYRVRNELIHDAAIIENIENLTGNLRYFLSFILNKVIEYFDECSPKPENSRPITMDDFFHYQEMIWQSIVDEEYDAKKMLEIPFEFDYLF